MRICSARREDVHEQEAAISEPLLTDRDVNTEEHENDIVVSGQEALGEESQIDCVKAEADNEEDPTPPLMETLHVVEALTAPNDQESEREIEEEQSQDAEEDDMQLNLPSWIRNNFPAIPHRDVLHQQQLQAIQGHSFTCEECCRRAAAFSCTDCTTSLCMSCADAIHIVRSSQAVYFS